MSKFSGRCLCGGVTYEGRGEPSFAGNCHCMDCRKASGGGHMALLTVRDSEIAISGETKGYDLKANSGATMTHYFCPNCGVRMFLTNSRLPGKKVMVASTLDDPEFYKPAVTLYASRALSWDQPDPATERFDEMPPAGG